MISLPRDTGRVPMFDGSTYNNRINTLEQAIRDSRMPLYMEPGPHHLDGRRTLMYVRRTLRPG